jgi:hypothetical protein
MMRKLTFLLLPLASLSQANEHLRGSSGGNLEQLVSQMMKKFEALEAKVEEQNTMIFELQERMETNEANHRRLNETDADIPDNECYPTYDSTLKRCIFDQNITFEEEVIFQDKVDFTSNDTNPDQPTVRFDTGVRFGDEDSSSHVVEFGYEAIFEDDVKFEDDVDFEDDVHFYEDVIVEGPENSNEDSTDFEISGHVDVIFEQDETFEIDTDTLMRQDVRIALESDDDKHDKHDHERRKRRKHRNLKSYKSGDEPTLYVEGSADFETDVTIIEGDLTIEEGGIIVEDGDLIVVGSIGYQGKLIDCWDGSPATISPNSLCEDVPEP